MATTFTSREFNQDTGGAKRAAEAGPVYITDRGRPSHVLMSFEDYRKLAGAQPSIIERLGEPAGIEAVDFDAPLGREAPRPAQFD